MNFRKKTIVAHGGIQLAPMVDVVFLLLCFFVATQMFARYETEIDITVPTAKTGMAPVWLPGEIILNITSSGDVVISGSVVPVDTLRARLTKLAELWPGQPVLIRCGGDTSYRYVIDLVDLCRQCDVYRISFATGIEPESREDTE